MVQYVKCIRVIAFCLAGYFLSSCHIHRYGYITLPVQQGVNLANGEKLYCPTPYVSAMLGKTTQYKTGEGYTEYLRPTLYCDSVAYPLRKILSFGYGRRFFCKVARNEFGLQFEQGKINMYATMGKGMPFLQHYDFTLSTIAYAGRLPDSGYIDLRQTYTERTVHRNYGGVRIKKVYPRISCFIQPEGSLATAPLNFKNLSHLCSTVTNPYLRKCQWYRWATPVFAGLGGFMLVKGMQLTEPQQTNGARSTGQYMALIGTGLVVAAPFIHINYRQKLHKAVHFENGDL